MCIEASQGSITAEREVGVRAAVTVIVEVAERITRRRSSLLFCLPPDHMEF